MRNRISSLFLACLFSFALVGCEFHDYAKKGDYEGVKTCLDKGVKVDDRDPGQNTALILAAENGYLQIVQLLVAHGADIHAKNASGDTPLSAASREKHPEIVDFLLQKGAASEQHAQALVSTSAEILPPELLAQRQFIAQALQPDQPDVTVCRFDPVEATANLSACLSSSAHTIVVPYTGQPWYTDPLTINRSDVTILLQEGVEINAKIGSYRGGGDSLITMKDNENVTIYGYGARLKMHKEEYLKPPYEKAEWRHGLDTEGTKNLSVFGLRVDYTGGDGVYVGAGSKGYSDNTHLKDLILRNNNRQGISVISAQDLLIENVEMSFTGGTAPSAGIDFEPNHSDERFVRCKVRNSRVLSNSGPGILVNLSKFDKDTTPVDITFENNTVTGNFVGLLLWGFPSELPTHLSFQGGKIEGIRITLPNEMSKTEFKE